MRKEGFQHAVDEALDGAHTDQKMIALWKNILEGNLSKKPWENDISPPDSDDMKAVGAPDHDSRSPQQLRDEGFLEGPGGRAEEAPTGVMHAACRRSAKRLRRRLCMCGANRRMQLEKEPQRLLGERVGRWRTAGCSGSRT